MLSDTTGMVNAKTIAKMKDSAVLINTAREELVDMKALADALHSGKLLGAGLDAIDEKTMAVKLFAGLNNIVLTAHLGGETADNVSAMALRCAEQIAAVSRGEKLNPPHLVNSEYLNNQAGGCLCRE
jgi:D-3-phosphoglycerate dehydrogenase